MNQFVFVSEEEGEEPIELPTEDDGALSLATLMAQFANSSGLRYRNPETGAFRGVRQSDGKLFAPDGVWGPRQYIACFPKESNALADIKRKGEEGLDNYLKNKKGDKRKCSDLIVLGLPWKSTEDDLLGYFSQFGELLMVQIKRDIRSQASKGFGFIRFAEYESQLKCLAQRHMIDGRWCDVRIPSSKGETMQQQVNRKIFVGRCTEDITADDLRSYFSKFGEVVDVFIPKPFRAFAFVTFQDPFVAQVLCGEDHIIRGASVHLSNAAPRAADKDSQKSFSSHHSSSGMSSNSGSGPRSMGPGGWNAPNAMARGGMPMQGGMGQASPYASMGGAGFPITPAMMAAAQAALSQGGWGALLSMAQNGVAPSVSSDSHGASQPVSMNTASAVAYGAQSTPANAPGGYYSGWSDGTAVVSQQQASWGQSSQAKPAGWN